MVRIYDLLWDDDNEEHVARHGVTPTEANEAARNTPMITRAAGDLYRVIGQTDAGRFLTVYVVTARDATSQERRLYRRRLGRRRWSRQSGREAGFRTVEIDTATWDRLRVLAQRRGLRRSDLAREWVLDAVARSAADAEVATKDHGIA